MQPESRLQRRIRRALEQAFPGSYWWKVHGGPFTPAGIPDLCGVVLWNARHGVTVGRSVLLEVKRPGERASSIQRARMRRLERAGAIVAVVTTAEEAIDVVKTALGHFD